jgi:hypothetical protein
LQAIADYQGHHLLSRTLPPLHLHLSVGLSGQILRNCYGLKDWVNH